MGVTSIKGKNNNGEQDNSQAPEAEPLLSDEQGTVEGVYAKSRYVSEPGEPSEYEKRFNRDYLIISDERRVFKEGVDALLDPNDSMKQLKSIRDKVEMWNKLKKGDFEGVDPEMIKVYESKQPLTVTALDFGCGDGRSVELWQDLAEELKGSGVTLRVKAYDVIEGGLDIYASRLTNPILPVKYSDSLKKLYGDDEYAKKLRGSFPEPEDFGKLEDFLGGTEYKKLMVGEPNELGTTNECLDAFEKMYGKIGFKDKLRGNFPAAEDYRNLKETHGEKEIIALRNKNPKFSLMSGDIEDTHDGKEVKNMGVFRHENLEIEFLCGGIGKTSVEGFKKAVGEVDMSLILYGSTSHITPVELRNQFIEAIVAITKDCVIATLPGQQGREEELAEAKNNPSLSEGEIEYIPAELKSNTAELEANKIPYATYSKDLLGGILDNAYSKAIPVPQAVRNDSDTTVARNWSDSLKEYDLENSSGLRNRSPNDFTKGLEISANSEGPGSIDLTDRQRRILPEGKKYIISVATMRNPADISMSWYTALENEFEKGKACVRESLPEFLKGFVKKEDVRYYGVQGVGGAPNSVAKPMESTPYVKNEVDNSKG